MAEQCSIGQSAKFPSPSGILTKSRILPFQPFETAEPRSPLIRAAGVWVALWYFGWGLNSGLGTVLWKAGRNLARFLPPFLAAQRLIFHSQPGQSSTGQASGSCAFYLRCLLPTCTMFTQDLCAFSPVKPADLNCLSKFCVWCVFIWESVLRLHGEQNAERVDLQVSLTLCSQTWWFRSY